MKLFAKLLNYHELHYLEPFADSDEYRQLYDKCKQVKQVYKMHQDKGIDNRINGLLSGQEKILSAIAEMRNKGSDSHGIGAKSISIAEHHARLFVNSAMTMAGNHPGIITSEAFSAVQAEKERRSNTIKNENGKSRKSSRYSPKRDRLTIDRSEEINKEK